MKIDRHIEIVASGRPGLNAMSKASQQSILSTLGPQYSSVSITIISTMDDLEALVARQPDLVVLGMKLVLLQPELGRHESPKIRVADYLHEHGINFTGSETDALALESNKPLAKQAVIDAGFMSPNYFISPHHAPELNHNLKFPLFVKPTNGWGSKGIDDHSLVNSQQELEAKITSLNATHRSNVLIEEYLPGREFSVAVIKDGVTGGLTTMPIEITAPINTHADAFLSAAVKHADKETVTRVTDVKLRGALNELAIGVFTSLGARDYGRVDIRLDKYGVPHFMEANLMPGLSKHGYLSRCFAMNEQIGYDDMIHAIVNLGFKRAEPFMKQLPVISTDILMDSFVTEAA